MFKKEVEYKKERKLKFQTKVCLSIMIREIFDIINTDDDNETKIKKIKSLLYSWINVNELFPEKVRNWNGYYYVIAQQNLLDRILRREPKICEEGDK